MNKLFISGFLFIFGAAYAQEITTEQKQILKFDNTARLSELIGNEDINQCFKTENNSYTLLALAIKMKSMNIFQKLIDQKVDLEKMCDGKTPLMFAAKYGDVAMAKKLLENGAKRETRTEKGLTALDYAEKYNQPEIIKLLK